MLAIAGGKGGSGKTTTTLGLARAVDGPTLAVDADCDLPNLHALAGVPRAAAPGGRGHPDPASSSGDTRIVPAPRDAPDGIGGRLRRIREREAARSPVAVGDDAFDGRGGSSVGDERAGRRGSGGRSADHEDAADPVPVFVDCPAGAGPDATVPLRVADDVLIVATPCVAALRDAAKTAAMARAVGTPVVGAVLTRARLAPPGVEDLLECRVLGTVPPASASRVGEPLRDPTVSRAYDELAERLTDRPNT
ncbi:MinD/ParA family ATP-binding protein [Halobellus rarus]|uniref:MinD/ParA family protein n=1 Tax=Halobellus rarus TaxID=1126237 RepID=A0ABD6CHS8_9EURY|nr:CDP-4-keto-6-deoxy-D-glucose-3-dehydrase [Halobellus rarus]